MGVERSLRERLLTDPAFRQGFDIANKAAVAHLRRDQANWESSYEFDYRSAEADVLEKGEHLSDAENTETDWVQFAKDYAAGELKLPDYLTGGDE